MIIVLPVFCFIYQRIVLGEENFLRSNFGDEYELYCKKANRWVPKLNGLSKTFNSMKFEWWIYVRNEYNPVFNLFISIGIVAIIFVEPLVNMEQQDKLKLGLIYFFSLLLIYLFIRYFDKWKKSA